MKANLTKDFNENRYIYHLPQKRDKSGLLFEVHFTGYEEIGINYHLERSEMENFMLTYTFSGTHNLIYDGKYYKITPDTLMFIDCLKPHETWGDGDYKIIYVHIYSPSLNDFCKFIHSVHSPVIPLDGDKIGFVPLLKEMHEDIQNNRFNEQVYSQKIYAMLLALKNHVCSNTAKLPGFPDYVDTLVNYVSAHYQEKLTLAACAKVANVSPNHLESVFKKYTGDTVAKYVANVRLKKAERLLVTTSAPISKIAEAVGLEESQVLIRLFKKRLGVTPLVYRNLYQTKKPR